MSHLRTIGVVLALGICVIWPQTSFAKTYVNAERVYTFEYPDDWAMDRKKLMSGLVIMGPAQEQGRVFCHSSVKSSPTSVGGDADAMIKQLVDKKVGVTAISAADTDAENFDASVYKIANSIAQRVIYDSGISRVSQVLAYNTVTGHTIDITCSAPITAWESSYGRIFDELQKSFTVLTGVQEEKVEPPDFVGNNIDGVKQTMENARPHITRLKMADGSFVPAETPEELKRPIISYDDGKRVVNRGILTAMAEHCELDWRLQSFLPFMKQERDKGIWDGKQLAYIGLLHGLTQGSFYQGLVEKGPCDEDRKSKVEAMLNRLHE